MFDRIIMNPPFSGGQDMRHVMHAWSMLKPGGRLVAIVSHSARTNTTQRSIAFRDFVEAHGVWAARLTGGTFADSGTQVGAIDRRFDQLVHQRKVREVNMPECRTCGKAVYVPDGLEFDDKTDMYYECTAKRFRKATYTLDAAFCLLEHVVRDKAASPVLAANIKR